MRRLLYAVPALEAFLRSGRLVVAAGLVALVLLSWLYLALTAEAMRAMEAGNSSPFMWLMPMGSWGASQFVLCFAMWAVMMIAMMTPSAAPMLFAFHALDRARPGRGSSARRFGAFLLGYFTTRLLERLPLSSYRRPMLGTGLCGGLTTFSTMQVEIVRMLEHRNYGLAAGYLTASVFAGLIAVYTATALVRRVRVRG